ncbi:MAG: NAD(P)/FAD-dependent oxidoreductase [Sulfurospirillum sp.]|nr:MAG: NAD(P)/FAD-dependent oxidoreductase [Sulfurospirillum sp.]
MMLLYDLIVVGSGAAGMISAITAARHGKKVLLLEKLSKPGAKLKATGGGRCNLTNTLPNDLFMKHFGRNGRFMRPALSYFDYHALTRFFKDLDVETHAPDGYRIFPKTHNAQTILSALEKEAARCGVTLLCSQKVDQIIKKEEDFTLHTTDQTFRSKNVIIATGGLGYPTLGAEGDGYKLAASLGHTVTDLHPAMMPLHTKERWVANCRADTIPKATIRVNLPKYKKLYATGDLIFTKTGIRGPVVLDFSREITPLLTQYKEVPLLVNMTGGLHEDAILSQLKKSIQKHPDHPLLHHLQTMLPKSVAREICTMCDISDQMLFSKIPGKKRDTLLKTLAWTPLTVTGHDGFRMAMITRGGISLKEIDPDTMQSKRVAGLYFCGEVVDLDGPCGGYNLQWSFASGYLAGHLRD